MWWHPINSVERTVCGGILNMPPPWVRQAMHVLHIETGYRPTGSSSTEERHIGPGRPY